MRRFVFCLSCLLGQVAHTQVDNRTSDSALVLTDTFLLKDHVVRLSRFDHDNGLAASSTTLDSLQLTNYDRSSLQGALAWAPGVQMDTRGLGGSARLSIRGSVIRAPFGVRGVKVYWGPFPITLADGTTPLELLDPSIIGGLEVVRSVASPVFGSAPAGLLLAGLPSPAKSGPEVSFSYSTGSNQYHRGEGSVAFQRNGRYIRAGGVAQTNSGYRDQEATRKRQAFIVAGLKADRSTLTCAVTYQQAYWELPGSLNAGTATNAPTSANTWSKKINAHLDKSQVFGGISGEQRIGRQWLLRATLTGQHINKRNPYGTSPSFSGLKDETYTAAGVRLGAGGKARARHWLFEWELGGESLWEIDELLDRSYSEDGELNGTRTDAQFRVTNTTPYLVAQAQLRDHLWFFAGVGGEHNTYMASDRLNHRQGSLPANGELWPHIGARLRMATNVHLYGRYAEGVSRPTVTEVWTGEAFDHELRPEEVREMECGIDAGGPKSKYRGGIVAYCRRIDDRITTVSPLNGSPYTTNSGGALMQGIEAEGTLTFRVGAGGTFVVRMFLSAQELRSIGTIGERQVHLAGVALITGGVAAQIISRRGWQLMVSNRYTGDVLAVDGGPTTIPGTMLCNARLGYELHIARRGLLEVFALCENVFNNAYSGWVQPNDPGMRYYNPAPTRSYFVGLNVRLR